MCQPASTGLIILVPFFKKRDHKPTCCSDLCSHEEFDRLVLSHLNSITVPLLDPLQFAYRANRSVGDAVNMALHLDSAGIHARLLLWTLVVLLIYSSVLCCRKSSPSWMCLLPPAGGSLTSCISLHQHWFPSGLCLYFSNLLLVYQQLHLQTPVCKLPKFADDTTLLGLSHVEMSPSIWARLTGDFVQWQQPGA